MAAEYSANAVQTVAANGSVIFTESPVPCNKGLVYHRDESGLFRLASPSTMGACCCANCCGNYPTANYTVSFHANISVPTGGTAEEITLALFVDSEEDPSSTMAFTPAAVETLGNVGAEIIVSVPCICRCSTVSVRNTSTQAINVENANIVFDFSGVRR